MHTPAELAAALDALRERRSYAELDREARQQVLDRGLPRSTVSDLLKTGRCTADTLEMFLRGCGVPRDQWAAWQQARERALVDSAPGLEGLVRVATADPRRLGVHKPIETPDAGGDLPAYVERDTDIDPHGLRALIARAAQVGGMVVLVGSSSVGKTRSAYEAVRTLLPGWWLLHPANAEQVRQAAAAPPPRLVVWLDRLERYLDGSNRLEPAMVRSLLHAGAVVVGTIWPEHFRAFTAFPAPGQSDPHAAERELVDLADVVHLSASFSAAEQQRARAAATAGDQRIALALQSADYGLTQTIAAAPQLVDRWRVADPYAAAVLNAAIDATRLGVVSPLSADLLRAAAPGYCDARQRATAQANWFEAALAYATDTLKGAAAALAPIASPTAMGKVSGYLVADYLRQHVGHQRRSLDVPATCWQALVDHVTDPSDQTRIAEAAQNRLLDQYAEPLYRKAFHTGDGDAAGLLAGLLAGQGRMEEALEILRARAEAGDESASVRLAGLLDEQGRIEEALSLWRGRSKAGDRSASVRVAGLLVVQGRLGGKLALRRAGAEADDPFLVEMLGQLREAEVTVDGVFEALMTAMKIKTPYSSRLWHSKRISQLAGMIGHQVGIGEYGIEAASFAGLFCNIGQLAVPGTVLGKDGPLTEEEYTLIKLHVTYGVGVVRQLLELFDSTFDPAAPHPLIDEALQGILHHHERFDGKGYPLGLVGEEIPEFARVIAVADMFDALRTTRSYRDVHPLTEAAAEIRGQAGTALDPRMVEAFLTLLDTGQIEELTWACPPCKGRDQIGS
ncbi:HD-GYP domain-containing protein [Nonomuraea polychroma]|uniref:HD-GYP domain-containing protein n=1 Tax=Nonomuraea polychroma TaxID=46176 RepID=UPI003D8A6E5C